MQLIIQSLLIGVGGAMLLCIAAADAADWPHWRGPGRNGIVAEPSGWSGDQWPIGDPVWNVQVGQGSTSPLAVDGRLYTMGWSGGEDTVFCLDAASGETIWKTSYTCPQHGRQSVGDKALYGGATATPEYDLETGLLYTLSVDGDLHCWDTRKQGERRWSLNLYDQYDVAQRPDVGRNTRRDYGYTSSPLVHDQWLIVEVGATSGTLMAFDKRTGKQQWVSECKDEAGHTGGPVPITVEGVPCVAVLTLRNLVVVRLDGEQAGRTVAAHPWATHFANNIATPAVHENYVLVTSAYNHHVMAKLKITLEGASELWRQDVASGVCSPVIHKRHVYWAWRGVHCLDLESGEEKWVGGGAGSPGSCIVTADERLIIWTNNGDLMLAETAERSADRYTELAQRPALFRTDAWPHVVLADGMLFCKDSAGNVICFALPQAAP